MKNSFSPSAKLSTLFVVLALGMLSLSFSSCPGSNVSTKEFTATEVGEIQAALKGANPASYRIIVPRFEADRKVGSQTLGTLSVAEVRRVASQQGVRFTEAGNLQAIFMSTPGTEDTSKASSQTGGKENSNEGQEIIKRLEGILSKKDRNEFIFLH